MRRGLVAVLVGLGLAAGASFAAWDVAERRMSEQMAAWSQTMRTQGWAVASAPPQRGGWPLAVEQVLPELSVTAAGAPLGWHAERATLRVSLLHPSLAVLDVAGLQQVRLGEAEAGYTAERFAVTLPLDATAPTATLEAARLRFGGALDGMTIGTVRADIGTSSNAATTLLVSAEAIALPPPPAPQAALGGRIGSATAEIEMRGAWPAMGAASAMAAAWRDGGGTLAVRRIAIGWGPLGVTGAATLALDDQLQPAGEAALRLVGIDAALDALVANRALGAAAAKAARAVLGLIAQPASDSGAAGVAVPFTLRGGTLAAGLFPLLRVPKLVWPDAPQSASVPP